MFIPKITAVAPENPAILMKILEYRPPCSNKDTAVGPDTVFATVLVTSFISVLPFPFLKRIFCKKIKINYERNS